MLKTSSSNNSNLQIYLTTYWSKLYNRNNNKTSITDTLDGDYDEKEKLLFTLIDMHYEAKEKTTASMFVDLLFIGQLAS